MPTKSPKNVTTAARPTARKRKAVQAEKAVSPNGPTPSPKQQEQLAKLLDLSTLKHPKREHQANFELFDARKALVDSSKAPWRYNEAGRVLFIKKLVEQGRFSDFPGLSQRDGIAITQGLMDWNQALSATTSESAE